MWGQLEAPGWFPIMGLEWSRKNCLKSTSNLIKFIISLVLSITSFENYLFSRLLWCWIKSLELYVFPLPNSLGVRAWPRQNTALTSRRDLLQQVTMVMHSERNVVLAEPMMINDECWAFWGIYGFIWIRCCSVKLPATTFHWLDLWLATKN